MKLAAYVEQMHALRRQMLPARTSYRSREDIARGQAWLKRYDQKRAVGSKRERLRAGK